MPANWKPTFEKRPPYNTVLAALRRVVAQLQDCPPRRNPNRESDRQGALRIAIDVISRAEGWPR